MSLKTMNKMIVLLNTLIKKPVDIQKEVCGNPGRGLCTAIVTNITISDMGTNPE